MTGMEVLSTAEMKELWIAGIGRLGITGADSLSVPCHSEERSDEESCSEYGRCKGRSFASLRMTGGGSAQDGRKENAPDDGGSARDDREETAHDNKNERNTQNDRDE